MIDRRALVHALRGFTPWYFALVAVAYLAAGVYLGPSYGFSSSPFWTAMFAGAALLALAWRYNDFVTAEQLRLDAEDRARDRAAWWAERQEFLDQLERDRVERERVAAEQLAHAVAVGDRCAADCADCDMERKESDAEHARFLRERAARHSARRILADR